MYIGDIMPPEGREGSQELNLFQSNPKAASAIPYDLPFSLAAPLGFPHSHAS